MKYDVNQFPMYEILFRDLGLRLPFTDLQAAVFEHLHLAPSQLHPNSIAFLWAFEIVCEYLKIEDTTPCFSITSISSREPLVGSSNGFP